MYEWAVKGTAICLTALQSLDKHPLTNTEPAHRLLIPLKSCLPEPKEGKNSKGQDLQRQLLEWLEVV